MRCPRSLVPLDPVLFSLVACERPLPRQLALCQVYRPHIAKRTFDGRVGAVLLRNASPRQVEVRIYHPDGIGDPELRWPVAPGAVLAMQDADGARLPLGNDWGIQVDQSCVATLGQVAEWTAGEFALRWEDDSLRAGLGTER